MATGNLGDIFLGVTRAGPRRYLSKVMGDLLRAGPYDRVVFPACGRFSAVEAAIQAGWPADRIEASDISLFTSLLGTLARDGNVKALNLRFAETFEPWNAYVDTPQAVGAVLTCMKIGQLSRANVHTRLVAEELEQNAPRYIQQMQDKADALASRLAGLRYSARDMMAHMDEAAADPSAIAFVFPPLFSGGYQKMWAMVGRDVLWDEPKVPWFEAKSALARLVDTTLHAEGVAILGWNQRLPEHASRLVYLGQAGSSLDLFYANKPDLFARAADTRSETKVAPARIPLLPRDHAITPASTVQMVETTKEAALYYRDLFAHKLGNTRSEGYFLLLLLDGFVLGVFGVMYESIHRGKNTHLSEVFGFTVPSDRYPRLSRLFTALMLTEDARRTFQARCQSSLLPCEFFQTVCLSAGPEVMSKRGLLKVLAREQRPDGRYRILYGAPFKAWTFRDAITWWLDGLARQQKAKAPRTGGRAPHAPPAPSPDAPAL